MENKTWIVKSEQNEKKFSTYKEAHRFYFETRKNWEHQINTMESGEKRDHLIKNYFDIQLYKEIQL